MRLRPAEAWEHNAMGRDVTRAKTRTKLEWLIRFPLLPP
jgi:hypothetical protein